MTGYPSLIRRNGQVTIPAEIRRALHLEAGDTVFWQWDGNVVRLVPQRFSVESAYASVKPRDRTKHFETLENAAKDDKANATMEELRESFDSLPER